MKTGGAHVPSRVCLGARVALVLSRALAGAPHKGTLGEGLTAALSAVPSDTEDVLFTPISKVFENLSLASCAGLNRYLQADIEAFDIRELTPKFDVILLEPPLEEYYRETGITANEKCWTWDDVGGAFSLVMRCSLSKWVKVVKFIPTFSGVLSVDL